MDGQRQLMEMLVSCVGSDCKKEEEGDYRDSEGLLVCHVCGKRKETRTEIPIIGVRVHPVMCDCQIKECEEEENRKKLEKEQRIVDEMFSYSLIDERFKDSTFEKCKENQYNERAIRIAKNYAKKFDEMYERNKGLLLYGSTGTGKTFIASCIANELLKKNVPLIVTSIIKLTSVTSPFSKEAEEQQMMIRKMNAARLLVIDDIGSERETDYKMEQVFDIIDSRYGSKKPMIITTNLSLEQMRDETNIRRRRIYERILEVCFPVKFSGPSWRFDTAKNEYNEIRDILLE